jgi:hypothetical protein
MWIAILAVGFVGIGFMFYGLDRLLGKKKQEEVVE